MRKPSHASVGFWRRGLAAWILCSAAALASDPAWWHKPGFEVIDPGRPAQDFAAVNQGQVKHLATMAYLHMQEAIPQFGGAGEEVTALIHEVFTDEGNYLPVNLGQLKEVARPFYDRLKEIGYTDAYPWVSSDPQDYAMANIGQVKNLFSFDLLKDSDGDGIPDWWEILHFGGPTNAIAGQDPDGDRLTNLQEYQYGTNPHAWDSSGDGISDYYAIEAGISPTTAAADTFLATIEVDSGLNVHGASSVTVLYNPEALRILAASTSETMRPAEYVRGRVQGLPPGRARFVYYQAQSLNTPTGPADVIRILFERHGASGTETRVSVYLNDLHESGLGAIVSHGTVAVSGIPSVLP